MTFGVSESCSSALRAAGRAIAVLAALSLLLASQASMSQSPPRPVVPAEGSPQLGQRASVASSTVAEQNRVVLDRADLEAWLDGFLPYAMQRGDIAGALVAVVKDGEVLLKKGYGYADVAARRPMDPEATLMRIGSVSKLFTWTAVMQLVEQGKIDLDQDVNQYLDFRVPARFDRPVTLRQLMAHRGGFEEGLKSVLMTDPAIFISTEQYLKQSQRPRIFEPGEVPAYSNYGTALSGYIVQRVSGEPFDAYVQRHIFAPLRMTRSTFSQPLPAEFAADVSKGYMEGSAAPRPFELVVTAPAGSMTATAADMTQFMLAYLQQGRVGDQQILGEATVRRMQGEENPYGLPAGFGKMSYGFFDGLQNGRRVVGHGGDTILFHSDLNLLLEEGVGIFFSANSRGAEDSIYGIRAELFDGFLDRYFPPRDTAAPAPSIQTAASDAQLIAGRYESSRRVETGFLSFFYMLGQTVIAARPDGTISLPSPVTGKPTAFRETAPNIWTEIDGDGRLTLDMVDGRRTVIDAHDPTSILQEVPLRRSAAWNLPAFFASVTIVLLTVVAWPVGALVRRHFRSPLDLSGHERWAYLLPRIASVIALVFLFGWLAMLMPILGNDLDGYNDTLDPQMRLLQLVGLVLIAAAGAALWSTWRAVQQPGGIGAKLGRMLIALALLDIVWIGVVFKMIGLSVDY